MRLNFQNMFYWTTFCVLLIMYAVAVAVPALLAKGWGLGTEQLYLRVILTFSVLLNVCVLFASIFQRGHLRYLRLVWLGTACVPLAVHFELPGLGNTAMSAVFAQSLSVAQAFPSGFVVAIAGSAFLRTVPFKFILDTTPLLPVLFWAATTAAGYAQWFIALPWLTTKVTAMIANRRSNLVNS